MKEIVGVKARVKQRVKKAKGSGKGYKGVQENNGTCKSLWDKAQRVSFRVNSKSMFKGPAEDEGYK